MSDAESNPSKRLLRRFLYALGVVVSLSFLNLASDVKLAVNSYSQEVFSSAATHAEQKTGRRNDARDKKAWKMRNTKGNYTDATTFSPPASPKLPSETRQKRGKSTKMKKRNNGTAKKQRGNVTVVNVVPYSQSAISSATHFFGGHPMRLLVFDGEKDEFNAYNLKLVERHPKSSTYQTSWCRRCGTLVPIMVDALRRYYPDRFSKGSPPFQVAFSTNDCISTECVNNPEACGTSTFPPIISFGTIPKDPTLLPTVHGFPLHFFDMCMFNWLAPKLQNRQLCKFPTEALSNTTYTKLIPQVIWRGTDYAFSILFDKFKALIGGKELLGEAKNLTLANAGDALLDEWDNLIPRWRGVGLTLKAEADVKGTQRLPWIDVKFVGTKSKPFDPSDPLTNLVTADRMGSDEMAKYKYQLDFGGVGGTTWLGTVNKLAMPGLLFHHETTMKDWYFDDIKPWVHYVPVKLDLSDLREKYEWAEANPAKAEKISNAGTEFALNMMSKEYMRATHEKYFVQALGRILDAYQPVKNEKLQSVLKAYEADGLEVYQFANCVKKSCTIRTRPERGWIHSLPLGTDTRFEKEDDPLFYSTTLS